MFFLLLIAHEHFDKWYSLSLKLYEIKKLINLKTTKIHINDFDRDQNYVLNYIHDF